MFLVFMDSLWPHKRGAGELAAIVLSWVIVQFLHPFNCDHDMKISSIKKKTRSDSSDILILRKMRKSHTRWEWERGHAVYINTKITSLLWRQSVNTARALQRFQNSVFLVSHYKNLASEQLPPFCFLTFTVFFFSVRLHHLKRWIGVFEKAKQSV